MLDPKFLRSQPEVVAAKLARRGFHFDLARFTELEARRKRLQGETEQLQAERNSGSKRIGQAKAKGEDASPILAHMDRIQTQLANLAAQLTALTAELASFLAGVPHTPHSNA